MNRIHKLKILESLIKQIPTAYNIEKVVEELKNEKNSGMMPLTIKK